MKAPQKHDKTSPGEYIKMSMGPESWALGAISTLVPPAEEDQPRNMHDAADRAQDTTMIVLATKIMACGQLVH
jgi:hypothetical protein